ncbi:AMP-binding protein [Marinobacterium jannaschii]|uniref:AMP-binding protein n=1 Tax=Marinobacterium jannaschii TaxID=64970 RepID=UPI0004842F21|nr:AMP-binding protein [Marinobacterium jannaschii]
MDNRQTTELIPAELNPEGLRNLNELFDFACRKYADRPAFTSFGRTLNFAELSKLANAFACYLQRDTELRPGDRIAIQLPNLIQYPVVLFGALRAGLVVVNTNPLYTSAEMEYQFKDSGAKALVIHKSMAHKAEKILGSTRIKNIFVTQVGDLHGFVKRTLLNAAVKYVKKMEPAYNLPQALDLRPALDKYLDETPDQIKQEPDDLAVLQYTGGTTGVSKGAMLSHANLVSNCLQGCERINQAGDDWAETVISPLPLYHIYAFTLSQIVMLAGGHSVLIPNPRDIEGFAKELSHWHPSAFLGLNTLFVALCNNATFQQLDLSKLKVTVSGGMALTHSAAELWQSVTGCQIMEGYGLTETSPAVAINPYGAVQVGTIGLPLAATEVIVIDKEGKPLANGEIGELCVRGPQVMKGYWLHSDESSACMTADGYLKTGDIAQIQPDGYVKIVDRAKDLIIVSGFNVYPNEVEDVISSHPDVLECAAIGMPDALCGETVKAYIVRSDQKLSEESVQNWCREHLSAYKVPKEVEFINELPKTNVGKVLRRMLRESADSHAA